MSAMSRAAVGSRLLSLAWFVVQGALVCMLALGTFGCGKRSGGTDAQESVATIESALTSGPVQINCGGSAAAPYIADVDFTDGATLTRLNTIDLSGVTNPAPTAVYQSQRYNNMSYTLPGFAAGSSNTIRLHFCDTKWTTVNSRLFNVTINGTQVLTNFDIVAAAGAGNKALAESFTLPANSAGQYVISFVGTKDAATVSGIEVGPSSKCAGVTCTPSDQCHVAGTCNPSTGVCSNPTAANGAACNDGSACTRSDSCQAGACVGANPVVCTAQDQCHGVGTCNTSTGVCSNPALANGTTCNDGNACTRADSCTAGVCTGSNPVVCTAQDQCHGVGSCNQSTGVCSNPGLPNGTTCNDGNACTQTDSCQAGACTGSNPITCMAGDSCHSAGACNASTGVCSTPTLNSGFCYIGGGCVASGATNGANTCETCQPTASTTQYSNVSNGTSCNDGNACTTSDACQGGTCIGNPVVCTATDQCHAAGMCVQGTGLCTNPSAPDGTTCTGTNLCNQTYACTGGACTGSNPVVCTAAGQCQVAGTCNPGTGACSSSTSAPNGTPCNDGNGCTTNDSCTGGTCSGTSVTGCGAPQWPAGSAVTVTPAGPTSAKLVWTAATDPVGVTDYQVYENGELLTSVSGASLSTSVTGLATGAGYTFTIQAVNATGASSNNGPSATFTAQAPNPAVVAPPLDTSVSTTIATSTAFLYTGPDPIQSGMTATIAPKRVAVLQGRVLDINGNPLLAVAVTVADHPEYGFTTSRADGHYDLVVNGGGTYTLSFEASGLISAQRSVQTRWSNYVPVADVALIARDSKATSVDLSGGAAIQVARASQVQDTSGIRQATLMLAAGTTAQMTLPGNHTQALTTGHVRATEFTVGPNGPAAMPAALPATSAYTYAAAFTVDEAEAAGATSVSFSSPVAVYLENFLAFNVGVKVPSGYYDGQAHVWVPSVDGRVVKVLSGGPGPAALDVNGSGQAASAATLAAIGISNDELVQVASLYAVGQTLWRVPVAHFSDWDFNQGTTPGTGAVPPNSDPQIAGGNNPSDCDHEKQGCIIDVEAQILGESVPVTGTPFSLNYRSSRTRAYLDDTIVTIPITPAQVPTGVVGAELQLSVAGETLSRSFSAAPGQSFTFTWDGNDGFARPLQGGQPITVRTGYDYVALPLAPSDNPLLTNPNYDQEFGHFTYFGVPASTNPARTLITLWHEWHGEVGHWVETGESASATVGQDGLGSWTLSNHNVYDLSGHRLYYGDGHKRTADTLPAIVTGPLLSVDGVSVGTGPIVVAPDGSMYASSNCSTTTNCLGGVIRITPDGVRSVVLDPANSGRLTSGDGKSSTLAGYNNIAALALDQFGAFYVADGGNNVIRKIDTNGIITTFAGSSTPGSNVDGVSAIAAGLSRPFAIVPAPDGTVYVLDVLPSTGGNRLLRISTDGLMRLVIQTQATPCTSVTPAPSGVPLSNAYLVPFCGGNVSRGLAVGPDGRVYVADLHAIWQIGNDGTFSLVAGNGAQAGPVPEGTPALTTPASPAAITLGLDGSLIYSDVSYNDLRLIHTNGLETTLAGTSIVGNGSLPQLATQVQIDPNANVATAPDGTILVSVPFVGVTRISPPVNETIGGVAVAEADGSVIYNFDGTGRHLSTMDARTKAILFSFNYESGLLKSIQDVNGDTTTIQRDATGNPIAIVPQVAPPTTLAVDTNGCLKSIRDPVGNAFAYSYFGGCLLQSTTSPVGGVYEYAYDPTGRLTQDTEPASGKSTLSNLSTQYGNVVTQTTAMHVSSEYEIDQTPDGNETQLVMQPGGLLSSVVRNPNGTVVETSPDGTKTTTTLSADPRFGMQAPFASSVVVRLPDFSSSQTTTTRAIVLANPNDLYSLASETDTSVVNGNTWTKVFTAGPPAVWITTSPLGRTSSMTIDQAGRPLSVSVPNVTPLSFQYDMHGRLQQTTQGARTWLTGYDANGYASSQTDPLSHTVSTLNDLDGRPLATTLQDLRQVGTSWDGNGNMLSITLPGGLATQPDPSREHQFSFTPVDLTQTYTPPAIGVGLPSTSYSYDADRFLTAITRPDGVVVTHVPDAFERLSQVQYTQGSLSYSYAPTTGQLLGTTTPGGETTTFTYDGFLQKSVTWSGPVAGSIAGVYKTDFHGISQSLDSPTPLPFGYDADGLLTCAGASICPATGALGLTLDMQNGHLNATALGNVADSYGYDPNGLLATYAASFSGSTLYSETIVSRDLNGRITEKTDVVAGTTHDWKYSYDPTGRLTDVTEDGAVVSHYGYDGDDNRTTFTNPNGTVNPTYDVQDRLTTYGAATYAFTANGELTSKTVGGQVTSYTYDELGNLLHVGFPVPLGDGTQAIDYIVDGQNRRVGKKVNGTLAQGWLYQDQLRPAAQLDGTGANVVARFVYGTKANVPDYMVTSGGTYRILSDHLGSPRAVVDVASGNLIETINFDEFGNETDTLAGSLPTGYVRIPFGFAGGLYDPDTGLVRFGARDYAASVGRWTAKDPIRFAGGSFNLYGYVINDPVNGFDPTGLYLDAQCIEKINQGCEEGCRGTCGGYLDAACAATCRLLARTIESASPGSICNNENPKPAQPRNCRAEAQAVYDYCYTTGGLISECEEKSIAYQDLCELGQAPQ